MEAIKTRIIDKLNKAIKENVKQAVGMYNDGNSYCAVGVLEMWNGDKIETNELRKYRARCPITKCYTNDPNKTYSLPTIIIHMNDDHRWSFRYIRNQIKKLELTEQKGL